VGRYPDGVRHSASRALLAALGCAGGLVATGVVAFVWPVARAHDAASLAGFLSLGAYPFLADAANTLASSVDAVHYAVVGLALVSIALVRRRPRLALAVPLTMLGATATTAALKPLVAHVRYSTWLGPGHQVAAASWPSGHATAAMTVALCSVLIAPAVLRPLVALLGSTLAIGVGYSTLILGWHFPSDVLGGFMVAGLWLSLSLALLWWSEQRWPVSEGIAVGGVIGPRTLVAWSMVVAVGCGLAVAALIEHRRLAATDVQEHASLIVGALAIASAAALMVLAVAVALRPFNGGSRDPTKAPHPVGFRFKKADRPTG